MQFLTWGDVSPDVAHDTSWLGSTGDQVASTGDQDPFSLSSCPWIRTYSLPAVSVPHLQVGGSGLSLLDGGACLSMRCRQVLLSLLPHALHVTLLPTSRSGT